MAEKMIRNIGDPVLREKCKPIVQVNSNAIKLLDDLRETLYAVPGRAGLAAPQIGIPKRAAVLDCGTGLIELINPEIIERKGSQEGAEGCLSIPNVYGFVTRAASIKVKTLTRSGEEAILEAEGHLAVCMQHEIDHLDGVLYIDHVKQGDLYDESTDKPMNVYDLIRLSKQGQ
ncbi:peptide deformylase [Paenibacillus validus]|uniref:Peptide deformylase n=1 Tax=Paenibacillus validus TaxID=44253 RepID=A0A7X2ZAY4_9BACL|nr:MULTISPECIES: peptide deformylase [Paenibacillus]MED4602533.1 peptide deformylase [Paenibacillus validus]MED4607836.1 peptide deformylase [Paenibacillus validus]MUG71481.1 peptide deformylase [Paenibacillus validus]